MKRNSNKKGYTLAEMMLVVFIICLLSGACLTGLAAKLRDYEEHTQQVMENSAGFEAEAYRQINQRMDLSLYESQVRENEQGAQAGGNEGGGSGNIVPPAPPAPTEAPSPSVPDAPASPITPVEPTSAPEPGSEPEPSADPRPTTPPPAPTSAPEQTVAPEEEEFVSEDYGRAVKYYGPGTGLGHFASSLFNSSVVPGARTDVWSSGGNGYFKLPAMPASEARNVSRIVITVDLDSKSIFKPLSMNGVNTNIGNSVSYRKTPGPLSSYEIVIDYSYNNSSSWILSGNEVYFGIQTNSNLSGMTIRSVGLY